MNSVQFNIVDIGMMILLVLGLIQGLKRGLSGELARLFSTIASFAGAWYLFRHAGEFLMKSTRLGEQGANVAGFIIILFGGLLALKLVRMFLKSLFEFSFKGKVEKLGGALAGLLRASVVVTFLLLIATMWPNEYTHRLFAEESLFGRTVNQYLGPVYEDLSEKYPALKLPGTPPAESEEMTNDTSSDSEADTEETQPVTEEVPAE